MTADDSGTRSSAGSNAGTFRALREIILVVVVVVAFGGALFHGLGRTDLRNDEAIYAFAVDRILETGNWLSPESIPHSDLPGDPAARGIETFLEKPPLKFWFVAAPISLGLLPHNEFGLRFWDAAFGTLAFLYVYLIGRRLVGPLCGLASVFLLFVHPGVLFDHGLRSNGMDAALMLAYAAGVYHFLAWKHATNSNRRVLHLGMVVASFAFGFMMKFVAAIFLPMVLGLAVMVNSRGRRRLWTDRRQWVGACVIALLLVLPWFVYQYSQHGSRVWQIMLGEHVLQRFSTSLDPTHVQPREFYFTQLRQRLSATGTLSWVTFGGLLWVAEAFRRRSADWALIALWYFLPVWLISLGTSKLYYYSYPFLPALMLVGGYSIWILARIAWRRPTGVVWIDTGVTGLSDRLTAIAGGRNGRGVAAAVMLVMPLGIFMFQWPGAQYVRVVEQTGVVQRPLRATRDCLRGRYAALREQSPGLRSQVYVHLPPGEGLDANYYYYYRVMDEWDRLDSYDRADLYRQLFAEGHKAVVFTRESEYRWLLQEMAPSDDAPSLIRSEARQQEQSVVGPDRPRHEAAKDDQPGAVVLGSPGTSPALLLLPALFRACQDVGLAVGGKPLGPALPGAPDDDGGQDLPAAGTAQGS